MISRATRWSDLATRRWQRSPRTPTPPLLVSLLLQVQPHPHRMVQTSSLSTTSVASPISPILPQSPAAGEAEPEPDIPNRRPGLDGLQDDVKSDDTKGGDGDEKEVEVTVLEKGGRGGMMNKVGSPLSHSPMLPRRPPPAAPSYIRLTCFIVLTFSSTRVVRAAASWTPYSERTPGVCVQPRGWKRYACPPFALVRRTARLLARSPR